MKAVVLQLIRKWTIRIDRLLYEDSSTVTLPVTSLTETARESDSESATLDAGAYLSMSSAAEVIPAGICDKSVIPGQYIGSDFYSRSFYTVLFLDPFF